MTVVHNIASKRIESLEITVVRNQSGQYGAYTTHEPLFFLTDDDQDRLRERIQETLEDYLQRFHGESVTVGLVSGVSAPEPIKVEKLSRYNVQLEYA